MDSPVISSRNSGGLDVIDHGVEGLLIDYGSDAQLTDALEWALCNPSTLQEIGAAASSKARRWSWEDYAIDFLEWLRAVI